MTDHGPYDNDVRGWTLDHDQFRGVLADILDQVGALKEADSAAANALARWWRSFSEAMKHHFRAEDGGIWPTLRSHAPKCSPSLDRLTGEHRAIEIELGQVDEAFRGLPSVIGAAEFDVKRATLLQRLSHLQTTVLDHLDLEERAAVPVLRAQVPPQDCARIERDMVKGLSLGEVADLLPRILAFANQEEGAMMLARLPPPVRLLNRWFFTPRYRRMRAALPARKA